MRIAIVQGTRPEIIKNYSLVKALEAAKLKPSIMIDASHANCHLRFHHHT